MRIQFEEGPKWPLYYLDGENIVLCVVCAWRVEAELGGPVLVDTSVV